MEINPMFVLILMVGSVYGVFKWLKYLSYRNWELIYTAIGFTQYFKIRDKVARSGVKVRTDSPIDFSNRNVMMQHDNKQYDIYVRKEDVGKALEAIHKN